jgi:hypothetical protein
LTRLTHGWGWLWVDITVNKKSGSYPACIREGRGNEQNIIRLNEFFIPNNVNIGGLNETFKQV